MTLLGWCMSAPGTKPDAHHDACPGVVTHMDGTVRVCECPEHEREET